MLLLFHKIMKKFIVLFSFLTFLSIKSHAFIETNLNGYSNIFYFYPNSLFTTNSNWDLDGQGFYLTIGANLYHWVKAGVFVGRANMMNQITSFNTYQNPKYKIVHNDYGLDVRIFPFYKYLFIRTGYIMSTSAHSLILSNNQPLPLFNLTTQGYQAGFGLDFEFDKICFGYNCGLQVEYLVRKGWGTKIASKDPSITESPTKMPNYREVMLSLGLFWYY